MDQTPTGGRVAVELPEHIDRIAGDGDRVLRYGVDVSLFTGYAFTLQCGMGGGVQP